MAVEQFTKVCTKCGIEKSINDFQLNCGKNKPYRKSRCKPCFEEYRKQWCKKNAGRVREIKRRWVDANPEKMNLCRRNWLKNNPEKARQQTRKYQASKKCAVPSWAKVEKMQDFYLKAEALTKETGIPHEVDHLVPLVSDVVCGLHCEFNLSVIPRHINRSKGNLRWPDMP